MVSKSQHRGFTLIELLVVIAIIGILSSVVLASLNSARERGRDTRRVADLKQLQLALELAYDADSSYPASLDGLDDDGYISVIPADPNGGAYTYEQLDSGTDYVLMGTLENTDNQALDGDVDGTVGTTDCADPNYCVQP